MNKYLLTTLFGLGLTGSGHTLAATDDIEALRKQVSELSERLDATTQLFDNGSSSTPGKTTIGGYGELHYNKLNNQKDGGSDKKELDFHRFVLFFGHRFSDTVRFHSELELEHALSKDSQCSAKDTDSDGQLDSFNCPDKGPGEVELEQAYIEFDLNDRHRAKGGVFLVPVGIINETHEPPRFFGVERNPVEKNIIPATWWEAGAALSGQLEMGFSYDLAMHSGLNTTGYDIRGGRQKSAKAKADKLAATARIKWTGMPGLELAASVNRQGDLTQGAGAQEIAATLVETHAAYELGSFGLKALYAKWDMDDDGTAAGKDEQSGWYIEPSFRLTPQFGIFARHNIWDKQAGDGIDSEYKQTDVGFNFWPHDDVVIKVDYQNQTVPNGKDEYDGINLGIGYQF